MAHWQGLGYYARARNLHKAAVYISGLGAFPATLAGLLAVPGVGRYTAGAIMSFAYDQYGPIVDGNVRRLYARYFAIEGVTSSSAVDKKLWALAEQLTPQTQCRSFAQGLLDLGATICKPRQPLCEQCPLAGNCQALLQNRLDSLPTAKAEKNGTDQRRPFFMAAAGWFVVFTKKAGTGDLGITLVLASGRS